MVDNHRSIGGGAFFRLLPRTILYVFGVFTDSFYARYGVLRDPRRGAIALTGSESVLIGAVRVLCPVDLESLWKAQPLEYYGYVGAVEDLPEDALVDNARRLDTWIGFLKPSPTAPTGEVFRAMEDDDQSYLMLLHAKPDIPMDINAWVPDARTATR